MESSTFDQAEETRACPACGSWVGEKQDRCPWCGTALHRSSRRVPAGAVAYDAATTVYGGDDIYTVNNRLAAAPDWRTEQDTDDLSQSQRGRHFWVRAFSLSLLAVVAMVLLFAAAGVYRGMNDRRIQSKRDAITYFEQGTALLEEGNYDLALANFREALRLEPNFEAAAYMKTLAEQQVIAQDPSAPPSDDPAAVASTVTPVAATAATADMERLFAEAVEAVEREEWALAAATLDTLSTQAPNFRPREVADGLFQARMEAGKEALDEEELTEAIRQFDHALAVRPNDEEAQQLRRLSSAYRTALRAYEAEEWTVAADQFRVVYLADPDFLDTQELLAQTHLELGQEFAERDIWCDAAQQFRSALAVQEDDGVSALARDATNRCEVRVAAPRATRTLAVARALTDSVNAETTFTPVITATETLTTTPAALSVTPTPRATTTQGTPTAAPPSGAAYQLVGGVGVSDDCGGNYIRGTVRNADGAPLPGVVVLAVDEWGNRLPATSKVDPIGQYDIPISGEVSRYEVMVVAGEQPLSAPVAVEREGEGTVCFTVNWQQTR